VSSEHWHKKQLETDLITIFSQVSCTLQTNSKHDATNTRNLSNFNDHFIATKFSCSVLHKNNFIKQSVVREKTKKTLT